MPEKIDPRQEYGVELQAYLAVLEERVGQLDKARDNLISAYRNLFATSQVDINASDPNKEPKWISRLDHAKMLRKVAEELL